MRSLDDIALLLAAYDAQLRPTEHAGLPPGVRAEPDGPVTRVVGRHQGFVSAPLDLGVHGADLDALILRQRDFFAARGEAVEWKTRGHDDPEVVARLVAAGFVPDERETVMIGLASELAAAGSPPDGVTLRWTTDPADMTRIAAMEGGVWDEDRSWLATELAAQAALGPDEIMVLVAEAGDEVVSAGWLTPEAGTEFAGLWGGSTVARWRRRGIYRSLVARRAEAAVARGVRYLQVDASDDSRPILERLGCRAVTTTTPYVWSPESPVGR